MFTDALGRRRHFVTCPRCGNMGPPSRVWSKKRNRHVLICAWCLEKKRERLRKRLDAETAE